VCVRMLGARSTICKCVCVCVCKLGDGVVRQYIQAQALFECRLHLMREGARRWIRAGTEALRWRQVCIDLSNTYSMYRLRKAVKVPSVLLPNSQVN